MQGLRRVPRCGNADTTTPDYQQQGWQRRQSRVGTTYSLQAGLCEEARQVRTKAPQAKAPPTRRSTLRIALSDQRHRAPLRSAFCAAITLLGLAISAGP